MALYKYEKTKPREVDISFADRRVMELPQESMIKSSDINIITVADGSYATLQKLVDSSKITNLLIPALFISLGVFFIFKHISPEIKTKIETQNGLLAQGTVAPVSDEYIDYSRYISNPAGLDTLSKTAFEEHVLSEDTMSKSYTQTFFLSIPSLGMKRIPVQPNVDSTSESVYLAVLKNSLAHFQNTGLPISDIENNIVIYGHSASPSYNPQPYDPEVAFSFLHNLKVGDEIIIEMEGKEYTFKMQKSKIVEPTDTSIINGSKGKRTLTLFTCYPAGNSAQRYVAVAREV